MFFWQKCKLQLNLPFNAKADVKMIKSTGFKTYFQRKDRLLWIKRLCDCTWQLSKPDTDAQRRRYLQQANRPLVNFFVRPTSPFLKCPWLHQSFCLEQSWTRTSMCTLFRFLSECVVCAHVEVQNKTDPAQTRSVTAENCHERR